VSRAPDFCDLVGDDLAPDEERRLRRAHELLLEAGPLPELPPSLEQPSTERDDERAGTGMFQLLPRRRVGAALALAAAIALVAFFGGYLAGYRQNGFTAQFSPGMHGVAGVDAAAVIKVGKRDSDGNWPLQLEVSGLERLKNGGYYEMFLTRGDRRWTCGTFAGGGDEKVKVRLNVPYELKRGDGWIVTEELPGKPHPGKTVMTT
jgi:hypothetical protein